MRPVDLDAVAGAQPAIGRVTHKRHQAIFIPEPYMRTQLRPKCAQCGAPSAFIRETHPLASMFPDVVSDSRHGRSVGPDCLVCGAEFPPSGEISEVPAAFAGRSPSILAARACFAIGRWLARLRRSLIQ